MRKKLKVKKPGIDEEEDMMLRMLFRGRDRSKPNALNIYDVATTNRGRDSSSEDKMSRHHLAVATVIALKRRSRQHLVVATSIAKT